MHRVTRRLRPAWWSLLRGGEPLSRSWGWERGTPVDRPYIEGFLRAHAADITGAVLEVKDDAYARRFGRDLASVDVVDIDPANPAATITADLAETGSLGDERFDCFVLTQTLHLVYDLRAALVNAHRSLRPGGVLLVTVPCISPIVPRHEAPGDYWRFTPDGCLPLFGAVFGAGQVEVRAMGGYRTALGFLAGMATRELPRGAYRRDDPQFPLVVGVRAVKA